MLHKTFYKLLKYFIATVWVVNGLVCKVFNVVPRHQQIVERILGAQHSQLFTKAIGVAEIAMALWILSGVSTRLNAATQIVIIAAMNIMEFFLASDLLLWGHINIIFALMFIILIYYNGFILHKKLAKPT